MLHDIWLSESVFAVEQTDGSWRVLLPDDPETQIFDRDALAILARKHGAVMLYINGDMRVNLNSIERKKGDLHAKKLERGRKSDGIP